MISAVSIFSAFKVLKAHLLALNPFLCTVLFTGLVLEGTDIIPGFKRDNVS